MDTGDEATAMAVETTNVAEENIAKQKTGLADLNTDAEAVPVNSAHFPQHSPHLTAAAQATLKALRGGR